MKISFLRSGTALKVTAFLAIAGSSAMLILPGCGGGGSGALTGGGGSGPSVTQRFNGTVDLDNLQRGTLAVSVRSDNSATGTFTIANLGAARDRTAAATTPFTVGTYQLTGNFDSSTGRVQLSGNIPGFGPFSIDVTPPSGLTSGSFVARFNGEEFNGTIPVVAVPTATPVTTGTPSATATPVVTGTPGPTTTPVPGGTIPLGTGPLIISLTSSNNALSGGNITNGTGANANYSQVGNSFRLNLISGSNASFPIRLFNLLIAKGSPFKAGDSLTVIGDAGSADVVSLQVTNISNPAQSGVFRGQSGTLRITTVVGRKVNFTISNLRMVSEVNAGQSFIYNGSGSFTIN